jgi:hypothetical protein
MGTKNNPGKFDCLAKAEPDEPFFVLLGRDPQAAHLVSIWSKVRAGDVEAARAVFDHLIEQVVFDVASGFPAYPRRHKEHRDMEKSAEAMACASSMFVYRKARK